MSLELTDTEIERIRIECKDEKTRFIEVFKKWQKNGNPSFTWNSLVNVLLSPSVNEKKLAEDISEKFCSTV